MQSVKSWMAAVALGLLSAHAMAGGKPTTPPGGGKPDDIPLPTDVLMNTPAPSVVDGHSPVSQVPEGDAALLALAGAGVVGALVWRRRRQGK